MRNIIFATLAALLFVPKVSYAQYAQFGMGLYPGMAMCPYGYGAADGAEDDDDELYGKRKARDKAKKELKKATREYEAAKKDLQRHETALSAHLNGSVFAKVKTHIEAGNSKDQAFSTCVASASANTAGAGAKPVAPDFASGLPENCRAGSSLWTYFASEGSVDAEICNQTIPELVKKSSSIENKYKCKDSIDKYGPAYQKMKEAAEKKAAAEGEFAKAKIEFENAKDDAKNRDDDDDDSDTEAKTCESGKCPKRHRARGPSNGQLLAGTVLGVLGGVLAYKGAKYAVDQNARLGWQSDPYAATGMGYPLLAAGIYGAMGGGIGMGGFGCAGTMGGAYPMGAMGMMNGAMNPFGGAMGGAFGYPANMMGAQLGGGMWNPGFSPGGGYNPYGGMMNPMMGNMMNPMMGMMNPMMGMQNPMMSGMQNPLAMQYQQQMMQQYMAQMQQQQQYQQAAMQDYMYRQQTVMSLQTQMQQIQAQIYQISMGGSYGYGASGSLLPYPSSIGNGTLLPYPSYNNGLGNNGLTTCIVAPCPGGVTPGYSPGTNIYTPRIGR